MAKDPRSNPDSIWTSVESFACNDESGQPLTILRGYRVRGGKGSLPERFAGWFIHDGALDSEVHAAREAAGIHHNY